MSETYYRTQDVRTGREAANAAVKLIELSRNDKLYRDGKNLALQRLFEMGFEISPYGRGASKVSSKMLQQVLWKTMGWMKPLDFEVHGTNRPEWMEDIVTEAVSTMMDRGGYVAGLRDKGGLFQKSLMWGDGWMMVGANPTGNRTIPIVFNPISNTNAYFDPYATKMRGGWGQGVRQCTVIFSYSWETAKKMYPKITKLGIGPSKIPRDTANIKELERTFLQTTQIQGTDLVEIGYYYDLDNQVFCVFAGSGLGVLDYKKGDKYPFMLNGEAYIPVINQMCMPSSEGIYNHGLFDMIYDLAICSAQLMNLAVGHAQDNVYPITIVNAPQGEASKFMNKLRVAYEMRAQGKKGYVVNEYTAQQSNATTASSLTTESLWQEWNSLYDTFTREVSRLGVNLDEIDQGKDLTQYQIIALQDANTALVKQIMEYNATEAKMAVEIVIDAIKEFVDDGDETPINMTTMVEVEGLQVKPEGITLGMVADELRKFNYFVTINARSGSVPSHVGELAQIDSTLANTPPGSPAFYKLLQEKSRLNNRDLKLADFGFQQGGAMPTQYPNPMEGAAQQPTERTLVANAAK